MSESPVTLKDGSTVLYWPNKRPLLTAQAARILTLAPDGKSATLEVSNAATQRKFLVQECPLSDIATPGAFTRVGVTIGGEFDRSDKAKLENAGKAAKQAQAAAAPATTPEPRRGRARETESAPSGT